MKTKDDVIVNEPFNATEHETLFRISNELVGIHQRHLIENRINEKFLHAVKTLLDLNSNLLGGILKLGKY